MPPKRDRDFGRKYKSGSEKKKQKKSKERQIKALTGSLDKFFVQREENSTSSEEDHDATVATTSVKNTDCDNDSDSCDVDHIDIAERDTELTEPGEPSFQSTDIEARTNEECAGMINLNDPATWQEHLNADTRALIVCKGPKEIEEMDFPADVNKRKFSKAYCKRHMPNGEIVHRKWLVYSVAFDRIFCFCCKLFGCILSALGSEGFCDWKNASVRLSEHEKSKGHITSTLQWFELQNRLAKQCTIDKQNQKLINSEKVRWHSVFQRLMAIVQFLAEHNMAFRSSVDKLHQAHNGNFLGLVEFLAKFDPVMQEHIRRIQNDEIHDHYLGKRIQNELISLMGNKVRETIIGRVKSAKYFSVILDCTPDQSHQEQMSLTIRYVNTATDEQSDVSEVIQEHFINFLEVEESTGKYLLDILLLELKRLGLDVSDIRGQGYDNGANMKGLKSGVQARLLQLNPRAFFTPCACHSYNLLLCDMAKTCPDAMTFFGVIQQIYVLFSASTKRWAIFLKYVRNISVKPLCETRWESRVESVKAVRYKPGEIYDALLEVSEQTNDPKARSEAQSLCKELKNFNFIVASVFWYDILFQFNYISKELQNISTDLATAINSMEKTCEWLRSYREDGFETAITTAKEIARELETEPVFKETRVRKRKKQFTYEGDDEGFVDAEKQFRINYFNQIVDMALMSMEKRFEQLRMHHATFGFLYKFRELQKTDLLNCSVDLERKLTHGETKDIDGYMLAEELQSLSSIIPAATYNDPVKILQFLTINKRYNDFPNTHIALRILLTVPITVASGERSFSKLKLIKTYMRSTMLQERLTNLAILSIENDVANELDYNELIADFASIKARKICL
jgi:hypothetical protein